MNKNYLFTGILIVILLLGVGFIVKGSQPSESPSEAMEATSDNDTMMMDDKDDAMMEQTSMVADGDEGMMMEEYAGDRLAGTTTPYLAFTQADYDKALSENKIVVLNFYANWCPICRAEDPDVKAAFESLDNPNVIGFQVNFKDPETDADEKALAEKFAVPYQHTKVILVDGKEVLKETAQWSTQEFVDAINNAAK